ncbi:hypothetical protein B1P88_11215 [Enterococcus faecium]|nr:hypothetical protein B1P87_09230 [Enterococcus faecium]OOL69569.1 hypothetical protein B1P88_11215 [Enterococcus faecium]
MNVPVTPLVQRYASFYNGFFFSQQVVVKKPLHLVLIFERITTSSRKINKPTQIFLRKNF